MNVYKANVSLILILFFEFHSYSQSIISKGQFDVYSTNNGVISSPIYSDHQFSDSWSIIKQFIYSGNIYFLLYDKNNGQIEILDSTYYIKKKLNQIKKTISNITPIDINSDGNDEFFFYSPGDSMGIANSRGIGEFYSIDSQFNLNLISSNNSFRNYWKDIIAYDFNKDGRKEILFYDPTNTYSDYNTKIFRVNQNYEFTLINKYWWASTWKILQPIKLGTSDGIIRYGYNGKLEILKYDTTTRSFSLVDSLSNSSLIFNNIVCGNFGGKYNSNIFLYDRRSGKGSFYALRTDSIELTSDTALFKKNWEIILSKSSGTGPDKILSYQREIDSALYISTYDGSGQAVHPDISQISDTAYRLVFTPYPFGLDSFENPSILISSDGMKFINISNVINDSLIEVHNPLYYKPRDTAYNISGEHNDDPDYFKENKDEYLIYLETKAHKVTPRILDENLILVHTNSNWASYDSTIILKERSSSNPHSFTVSQALIKKDSLYFLFFVNAFFSGNQPISGKIQYLISDNIHRWKFIKSDTIIGNNVALNDTSLKPWHLDVIFNRFDGNYYMLIAGKAGNTGLFSSASNSLYIAKSSDLVNWKLYSKPIIAKDVSLYQEQIYRSTGIFRDYNLLDIYYSFPTVKSNIRTWHINLRKNFSIDGLFPPDDVSFSSGDTINADFPKNIQNAILTANNYSQLVQVFPNPVRDFINIAFLDDNNSCKITCLNSLGMKCKEINQENENFSNLKIDLSDLPQGIYFLFIQKPNKNFVYKIIKM